MSARVAPPGARAVPRTPRTEPDYEVAIVGSGFSGLGMGIRLKQAGRSFVIFEQADSLGGTWRDNHYPGCACDVQSHLYSFSFEPNPRWSRMFAPHHEIQSYLEHCADKYGVRDQIRFGTAVKSAELDEAAGHWLIETSDGRTTTARHVVFGVGALSRPAYPAIEGIERFGGKAFHSARWDHDYPLDGKRVAVIGTGASAIQIIPQIAPKVAHLSLFQRTPAWVLPKPDRAISQAEQRLYARLPGLQRLYRWAIYWMLEARAFGFTVSPQLMKLVRRYGERHIESQIEDPALRAKLIPDYTPGCKRILMADDYYPALARPNVSVIQSPIARATERGLVSEDGVEHPLDAIVYATGFRVTDMLTPMRVVGRGGIEINDAWKDGIEAYLGSMVSGFPNAYLLMGPNTGLGHNSMIFMIEAQVSFALELMRAMDRQGARLADVRPAAQRAYNDQLAPRLERTVWASGCKSWYLDQHGKNSALWPGFTLEYWLRTRRVRLRDFQLDPPPLRIASTSAARAPAAANW